MNDKNKTANRLMILATSGVLALGTLVGTGVVSAQTAPSMPMQMQPGQMQPGQMRGQPRTLQVKYYDADPRKGGKLVGSANVRVGRPPMPGTTAPGGYSNGQAPGQGRIEVNRGNNPAVNTPANTTQQQAMGGRMGVNSGILAAAPSSAHYAEYTARTGRMIYINLDALRRAQMRMQPQTK